jgi:hypothetical protein
MRRRARHAASSAGLHPHLATHCSASIAFAHCSPPPPRAPPLPRIATAPPPCAITGASHLRVAVPAQRPRLPSIRLATTFAIFSFVRNVHQRLESSYGEALSGVFPLRCSPRPPLADVRGRSSLHPLSLFGLCHQHRLHLAVLVRASSAATTACAGQPPCVSTTSPP